MKKAVGGSCAAMLNDQVTQRGIPLKFEFSAGLQLARSSLLHPSPSHANMNSDTTAALRAATAGDENNANVGDDTRRPSPKSVATNATNFDDHKNTPITPSVSNVDEDADVNAKNDEPEPEQATVTSSPASADTATTTPSIGDGSVDGVNSTQMQIVPTSSVRGKQQQMILAPQSKPHESQSIFARFTLNRETTTIAGLAVAGGITTTLAGTICFIGVAAFASSPLWLPLLLITSPFWLPFAFFTSPLWVSAVAIGAICLLWAALFAVLAFGTFLFFSWPAQWLPKDSDRSKWFLCQRDRATLALVKLQAKIVLYAAGVGPLADAAFAITDRIDLVELQKALSDFDLAQFAEDVKKMDIGEIQGAIVGAIRSFIGL